MYGDLSDDISKKYAALETQRRLAIGGASGAIGGMLGALIASRNSKDDRARKFNMLASTAVGVPVGLLSAAAFSKQSRRKRKKRSRRRSSSRRRRRRRSRG